MKQNEHEMCYLLHYYAVPLYLRGLRVGMDTDIPATTLDHARFMRRIALKRGNIFRTFFWDGVQDAATERLERKDNGH